MALRLKNNHQLTLLMQKKNGTYREDYLREHQIQGQLWDHLRYQWRCKVIRNNTGAYSMENNGKKRFIKYGEKGSGDLFFWLPVKNAPPVAGYIEVKSEVGRPTPAQEVFRQECEFLNILYIVARSITDVDRGITEYLDRFHLTAN